jgi:hypothetical protein
MSISKLFGEVIKLEVNAGMPFTPKTPLVVYNEHRPRGTANWVIASDYTQAGVDDFLATAMKSHDQRERMALMAQAIIEPIEQVVPYVEMYRPFFMDLHYTALEDNKIPVEDIVNMAWETVADGGSLYTRVGSIQWVRPSFEKWDTGVRVPWESLEYAGWNFLARQMRRATEAIARKHDIAAKLVADASIDAQAGHHVGVAGGLLTKAAVDSIIKTSHGIGFPVTQALVNTGVMTDMVQADWFGPTNTGGIPMLYEKNVEELLTNLYIGSYGGVSWWSNPNCPTGHAWFGGPANQIGYHQTKGEVRTVSDIDIDFREDKHLIIDMYHAWYIGNGLTLYRLDF